MADYYRIVNRRLGVLPDDPYDSAIINDAEQFMWILFWLRKEYDPAL